MQTRTSVMVSRLYTNKFFVISYKMEISLEYSQCFFITLQLCPIWTCNFVRFYFATLGNFILQQTHFYISKPLVFSTSNPDTTAHSWAAPLTSTGLVHSVVLHSLLFHKSLAANNHLNHIIDRLHQNIRLIQFRTNQRTFQLISCYTNRYFYSINHIISKKREHLPQYTVSRRSLRQMVSMYLPILNIYFYICQTPAGEIIRNIWRT